MSTPGLPTIWELVADGAAALPEPFSRAALINWVSARRPEVGVSSIATHIQFATANAAHTGTSPFADREPLLRRVGRGQYERYRSGEPALPGTVESGRVVVIGSSGATADTPLPAGELFRSDGFIRARDAAVRSSVPWFVLSAKHGLLDPDEIASPHALQIDDQPAASRTAWGEWVGAVLEIPLPGTWREAGPAADDENTDPSVRGALIRLRGLVGRHHSAS